MVFPFATGADSSKADKQTISIEATKMMTLLIFITHTVHRGHNVHPRMKDLRCWTELSNYLSLDIGFFPGYATQSHKEERVVPMRLMGITTSVNDLPQNLSMKERIVLVITISVDDGPLNLARNVGTF